MPFAGERQVHAHINALVAVRSRQRRATVGYHAHGTMVAADDMMPASSNSSHAVTEA